MKRQYIGGSAHNSSCPYRVGRFHKEGCNHHSTPNPRSPPSPSSHALQQRILPTGHPDVTEGLRSLSVLYMGQERVDEAVAAQNLADDLTVTYESAASQTQAFFSEGEEMLGW